MGNDTSENSTPSEAPGRQGVYRATHDPDGPVTVSDTVIRAIADVADVDPTNTVIPLSESIDPDALDALFASDDGEAQARFRVCGLEVLVWSDGRIRIVDETAGDDE